MINFNRIERLTNFSHELWKNGNKLCIGFASEMFLLEVDEVEIGYKLVFVSGS